MDYDAFISYAHADGKDAAQSLKATLRGAYLDQHGNRAGGAWHEQIQKAITQSSVFFFLITPDSVTSDFCQQEWAWARAAEKPIIPMLIERVIKILGAEGTEARISLTPQET
ncbi:MAG: toll/interleukin-1 receptor domain-containing protein [Anaerolineaceae bacterium]|nr:toll/interleukin-1 receptor domain-containing protein [Anaerolineaceae bacterium]